MSDWHYMRLTGKKGDSGSELMVLYSAQNSVSPNDDPDRYYWHTSFQPTDFFMCTKSEDSELWGNIMKIVGEGLTVQYSADGSTNWHNPPAVATDKYMRQKMDSDSNWGAVKKIVGEDGEDGEDGANGSNIWYSSASATTSTTSIATSTITILNGRTLAVGDLVIASGLVFSITAKSSTSVTVSYKETIKGADGANAVVMTSTSKPDGTYTNQVGFYQTTGKFYRWTGLVWSEIPMATPSDISTLTPRYIGAFPSASAPTASDYNAGDGYLNTSNSKLYIKVGSAWSEQSSVTESNRNMYNLAMKDMLNLAGATGTVAEYATAFVENLFADKATINELQSMSVLFKDYCGSIMSQNPNIGDTMIYMGKNPRLSSVTREFQFAISEYLGKVGQQEMWSDKLITKILASGILALSVMGCVQATEGVYSHIGEALEETNVKQQNIKVVINSSVADYKGGVISVSNNSSSFYMTKDWKNYTNVYTLNDTVIAAKRYRDNIYILTKSKLYKTSDVENFSEVTSIPYQGVEYNSINRWVKNQLLLITTKGNIIYYSQDGVNWSQAQGTNNFTYDLCITDDRIINLSSVITETLEYYIFNGTFLVKNEISNPFKWSNIYAHPRLVNTNDNSYIFVAPVFDELGSIISAYTVSLNSSLENKTLLFGTGTVSGFNVLGVNGKYMIYSLIQNLTHTVWRRDLINNITELMIVEEQVTLEGGAVSGDFGYVYFCDNNETHCYITNNGAETFTKIKLPDNTFTVQAFKIDEVVLYFCVISINYDLYISRGREAGSGIIDESFGTEQNYTLNSNGQLMQWGKQTFNRNVDGGNNVAGTAITFPKEFKSEPVVSVTHFNGNQFNMTVRDVSTTGFTPVYRNVNNTSNANTQGCYWIAIGT